MGNHSTEMGCKCRLNYQPLFGKMSSYSSPESLSSGRIKDRTWDTAEIEPIASVVILVQMLQMLQSKRFRRTTEHKSNIV